MAMSGDWTIQTLVHELAGQGEKPCLISIDGDPPIPRLAVFACGSSESRIDGSYRFIQTADCVALAEERGELDLPGPPKGTLPGDPL